MKKKLSILVVMVVTALFFAGCSSNGVSNGDVTNLINGPTSIKGTISGTMQDNTPFNFPYDYHVTTNDGNSYAESWIENSNSTYANDTILYVWQYFYFDNHGYADYGDQHSPSGKYVVLEMYIDIPKLKQMPSDYSKGYFEGMWQNTTAAGNRFVYGITYYGYNSNPAGTMTYTNLKYDKNSQILSGTWNASVPANTTGNNLWYGNANATTFTGDFKIFVSKETLTSVTKSSNDGGNVYRQHKTSNTVSVK